jgi:hypothetical protein
VLAAAERATAQAELTGQQAVRLTRTSAATPPASTVAENTLAGLIAQLGQAELAPQRVVRRDLGTRLPADPRTGAVPGAAQAPTSTIGPLQDAFGRSVVIDVFAVPVRIGLQRTGAAQPFLYVELPPPTGSGTALTLGPGSVWIDASLLATSLPAPGFVGLRIKGGTINLGSSVPLGVSPIVMAAAATVALTLVLDPATASAGGGPGEDARAAAVSTPSEVTLTFAAAAVSLTSAGNASITAFGATLALTLQGPTAHYDPVFGRIDFPFVATQPGLTVASSLSTLATFAGSATLFGAAWSLPIDTSDATSLGAAAGAGGVALGLLPGLTARWTGRTAPAACGTCVLLVEPGLLAVGGLTAQAANVAQSFPLAANSTVRLTTPAAFPFRFTSESTGLESWSFVPLVVATLDQPRTVNNARVRLSGEALVVLLQTTGGTLVLIEAAAATSEQTSIQSYCLQNVLLKASDPLVLVAVTPLSDVGAGGGTASVQLDLRLAVPILPDPYATNLLIDPRQVEGAGVIGLMTVRVTWLPAAPATLDVSLPAAALDGITAAPPSTTAAAPAVTAAPAAAATDAGADSDDELLGRLQTLFDTAVGAQQTGPTLLDLSTNVSQFGVTYGAVSQTPLAGPVAAAPSVAGLFLQLPGVEVRVVTLPAVQWEPVLTPDQSTFPSPLTFANSGQPVVLGANSVTLVPVAPRQAIDALLAAYNAASATVAARFTLPFGIAAVAELQHPAKGNIPAPTLSEVQPSFSAIGLSGGDQLSIRAAQPLQPQPGTPSLPGSAIQLHNARAAGVPTATTVLTPIDVTFDDNFGPAAASPRVPVTRIDISGYGESLFSDWRNPTDAAAIISKAQFNVFVGRTTREVVQAYSIHYPFAVRLVRTIVIDRLNGAAVARHDTGWQPVSDGLYSYPNPKPALPALVTHPGVVLAAVAITNIRDTGQIFTTPDGSELMAVRFDCALTMENVVRGAGPNGVPALNQLGYVQLTDPPNNGRLAPDQYVALLTAIGPLGGVVDCTINIGGTGQLMRVTTVGVAATTGPTGPEFAMAAWGSPVLPAGGDWSFLRQPAGALAPEAVDPDQGVPLVRAGPATAAPPATSPYLFADPADLLHPTAPSVDYGLVHATGTQRVLFPRPKLEASGAHAITSTLAPVLADPYALATATGPFPRIAACIPFPNASYALAIATDGNLSLQPAPFTFTSPVLKRILRESTTVRSIAYTADENNNPAVVTLAIDTAAAEPWSVQVTNLSLANESGSLGEMTRVVGNIASTPSTATQLADARFVFGPPLKPVAALVSFLEQFGNLPPPSCAMSNNWQLLAGITFDFTKYALFLSPAIQAFVKQFIVDLDVKMQSETKPTTSNFVMQFDLTVKIPTPFPPVVGIALARVQFQIGDDGTVWTFQLGVGIGVSFTAGPFDVTAYYVQSQFLITGDSVFGLGASSLVKGTVELEVASVSLSIEAKIALLKVSCNVSDSAIWAAAQVTIAFEISIFFVIDIEFDAQAEWTQNLDGGPCALPDVL